jgi:hypothetical protein
MDSIELGAFMRGLRDRDMRAVGRILGAAVAELALILTEPECAGIPILNMPRMQVDAAVEWLLGDPGAGA